MLVCRCSKDRMEFLGQVTDYTDFTKGGSIWGFGYFLEISNHCKDRDQLRPV